MYQPTTPPDPSDPVQAWMMRELLTLSRYLSEAQDYVTLDIRYAVPKRPRAGMVVNADGTTWNPGGGAGLYQYLSGAWVKL